MPDDDAGFVPYEFMAVRAPQRLEWVYRCAYQDLGWVVQTRETDRGPDVVLWLRRDWRMRRVEGLKSLENVVRQALSAIRVKERVRVGVLASAAFLAGVAGAGFAVAAVISFENGRNGPALLLGGAGVGTWTVGLIGYRPLALRTGELCAVSTADQYAAIDTACDRAVQLRVGLRNRTLPSPRRRP